MKVINHTSYTEEQIFHMPMLGSYRNEWRQRDVALYRLRPGMLISVGTFWDQSTTVICEEADDLHARALDAFAHGRSYTFK